MSRPIPLTPSASGHTDANGRVYRPTRIAVRPQTDWCAGLVPCLLCRRPVGIGWACWQDGSFLGWVCGGCVRVDGTAA